MPFEVWLDPARIPSHCSCGLEADITHSLSCPLGGYPQFVIMIFEILRQLSSTPCARMIVSTEPMLQPLTGENLRYKSAVTEDHAHLDVAVSGLWGSRFESTFIDVQVFNLMHSQIDLHYVPLCTAARTREEAKV